MKRKSKAIAFSSAALALIVVVATSVVSRDKLREQWLLHELQSTHEEEVEATAWQLKKTGSFNAMIPLIAALDCEGRHPGHVKGETSFAVGKALEDVYLRHNPKPGFPLSYWDGPPQVIRLFAARECRP